jgi:SAM-dependent methyltransferase
MLAIERSVCGCDYGATSWTTRSQADRMGRHLRLRPGMRLLDLGAGSGWPGLYLCQATGCDVVLADLPLTGLRNAVRRTGMDGLLARAGILVADASSLPFAAQSFDAISHSDLLCCLTGKRATLAACRDAIRPGGPMVFTVILIPAGLSEDRYRRAAASGPEFIEADMAYPELLGETGWLVGEREDITEDYRLSCARQLDADRTFQTELLELIGPDEYEMRVDDWRTKLSAIDDGLMRRELFLARPA